MAKQVTKSNLMSKYGADVRAAILAHKDDETTVSNVGELPAGVNGVAKLVDCRFGVVEGQGKKMAGQPFFYAAGVVVSPDVFTDSHDNEHHIKGLRTSIMEMVCPTPESNGRKTVKEHIAWVLNEIRKLGVDTSKFGASTDLDQICQLLVKSGVHFKFRTWKSKPTKEYPDPRVNHTWSGVCEYEAEEASAVDDSTAAAPDNQEDEEETQKKVNKTKKKDEEEIFDDGAEDLDSLVKEATEGDSDAQNKLLKLAVEAGVSEEEAENADDWETVVKMMEKQKKKEKKEEDEDEKVETPEEGDIYKVKQGKKTITVEVVSVSKKTQTVTVKNVATDEESKVKWAELMPA